MTNKITIGEIRDLLKHEEIRPSKIFSKEDFIKDEKLIKAMVDKSDLEDYRAGRNPDKVKEETEDYDLIPGDNPKLTPEEKKKQDKENELIPDNEPGDDGNDLIPD